MERERLIQKIIKMENGINRSVGRHEPEAWMDLNLTIGQLKSLFFISTVGSTNFRNLAVALGRTPPEVTRIIDRLVEQGLVSRRENPKDRRMLVLKTTEAGKALVDRLKESRLSRMRHIMERLSEDELKTLVQGLAILTRVADVPDGEAQR